MTKQELKDKFKHEVTAYLSTVTAENLQEGYQRMAEIVLRYKGLLITKDIYAVFSLICDETDLNDLQDELIIDTSNRLYGHCPPKRYIEFD